MKQERDNPSAPYVIGQIYAALSLLDPRERQVLVMRYGLLDGQVHTPKEIGDSFGVCGERIRQIEAKALRKLPYSTRHQLRDYLER